MSPTIVSRNAFVEPLPALAQLGTRLRGDAGAVVLDDQAELSGRDLRTDPDPGPGPLAGVVEQVAAELEQVVAVHGHRQWPNQVGFDLQVAFAVEAIEARDEFPDHLGQVDALARGGMADGARALQFALHGVVEALEFAVQGGAQFRLPGETGMLAQLAEDRERRLERMGQVSSRFLRALGAALQAAQGVVERLDQRQDLVGTALAEGLHLARQQAAQLVSRGVERAQRPAQHQQLQSEQRGEKQEVHGRVAPLELFDRRLQRGQLLGHGDADLPAALGVLLREGQQRLGAWAGDVGERGFGFGKDLVPQRAGAQLGAVGVHHVVVAAERPAVDRVDAVLRDQGFGPGEIQRGEQRFGIVLEPGSDLLLGQVAEGGGDDQVQGQQQQRGSCRETDRELPAQRVQPTRPRNR